MSKVYQAKKGADSYPTKIENVWEFFSSPENLKDITAKTSWV